jgi:hypothetical protein
LTWEFLTASHQPSEPSVFDLDVVLLARLAPEAHSKAASVHFDVTVLESGEAERVVPPTVLGAAYPHQSPVEQSHDQRGYQSSVEGSAPEFGLDLGTHPRQNLAELDHRVELAPVTLRPPRIVIAVLLATSLVSARRLNVTALVRADPHVRPRWRDVEPTDPVEYSGVCDPLIIRPTVGETATRSPPTDPRLGIRDVAQGLCRGRDA